MKHGRRDVHHVKAGELARAAGFTTFDCGDFGDGHPDWCWGKHGLNFWVEIKTGSKAPLQPMQLELALTWRGQWVRADTPEEAVQLAEAYVAAFTKPAGSGGGGWNARPVLTAADAIAREKNRVAPRTGRRGARGRARGPRRGR